MPPNKDNQAYAEIYPAVYDKFKNEDDKLNQIEIKSGMVLTFATVLGVFLVFAFEKMPLIWSLSVLGFLLFSSFYCLLNFYPVNVREYYFKHEKIDQYATESRYQKLYKYTVERLFRTQEAFEKLIKEKFIILQSAIEFLAIAFFIFLYALFIYVYPNVYMLVIVVVLFGWYLFKLYKLNKKVIK